MMLSLKFLFGYPFAWASHYLGSRCIQPLGPTPAYSYFNSVGESKRGMKLAHYSNLAGRQHGSSIYGLRGWVQGRQEQAFVWESGIGIAKAFFTS